MGSALVGAFQVSPQVLSRRQPLLADHGGRLNASRRGSSPTRQLLVTPARNAMSTRKATQLNAFLPPGGGGGKDRSELGQVATAVLTFAGITLFFLSPLGALFFAVFNSLLALSILIPVGGFVAFQVWSYFNTVKGPCPNCAAPVQATKDGAPTLCFNCGAIVQAKDDGIYLANPNQRDIFAEDQVEPRVTSWFDGLNNGTGGQAPSSRGPTTEVRKTKTTTTIIDVDVIRDDD